VRAAARLLAIAGLAAMTACQAGAPSEALSLKSLTGPTDVMVGISRAAQACWFKTKDRAFVAYRMADEVNSPAGRPRILLVPRNNPTALPVLVVQAETKGDKASGRFSDVQAYGPLMNSSHGQRIAADVKRWAAGDPSC